MLQNRSDRSALPGIQILRGLAALGVVCHHTLEESNGAVGRFSPNWLTTSGASGVDLFFVISGFIMMYVSFRADRGPPTPISFLFRRATRIYPFYWLCSLAMLLIWQMGFMKNLASGPQVLLSSLLLLPGPKLIGISWTLVYEVYFYLIFGAMLWFRSARIAIIGTTAAIVVFGALSALMPSSELSKFLASPLPFEFCFGIGIGYVFLTRSKQGLRWPVSLPVAILGFAMLAVAPVFVPHSGTAGLPADIRVVVWGIPATLVVAGILNIGVTKSAISRFAVLLGDASYALYLTHVFVMIGYGRLIKIPAFSLLPQQLIVVIIVVLAVAIGIATHLFVEKPMLKLIRHLSAPPPAH